MYSFYSKRHGGRQAPSSARGRPAGGYSSTGPYKADNGGIYKSLSARSLYSELRRRTVGTKRLEATYIG